MMILDATTKSLQVKLSGAITTNQLPFSSSYVDVTSGASTPGEQDGTSNNTAAVTTVSAPAASAERLIKSFIMQNADTAAATVTVIYNNNSTLRNILVVTLAVGDQLIYEDGEGWTCLDKNGNVKYTVAPSSAFTAYATAAIGQLPGTTTNDSASAGNIGEYVSSTVNSGSAVALTSSTSANITSITLSAGDWDISGKVGFVPAATTTMTLLGGDINTTSAAAFNADTAITIAASLTGANGNATTMAIDTRRVSLSGSTTYYLNCIGIFATSTLKGYGIIRARRVR
jgi:hypothetical protein